MGWADTNKIWFLPIHVSDVPEDKLGNKAYIVVMDEGSDDDIVLNKTATFEFGEENNSDEVSEISDSEDEEASQITSLALDDTNCKCLMFIYVT